MPTNLSISLPRRCAFFEVHASENGVLSPLLLDGQYNFLLFALPLPLRTLVFLLLLQGPIVCEHIKLDRLRILGFLNLLFVLHMVADDVHAPDKEGRIYYAIIEFGDCGQNLPG